MYPVLLELHLQDFYMTVSYKSCSALVHCAVFPCLLYSGCKGAVSLHTDTSHVIQSPSTNHTMENLRIVHTLLITRQQQVCINMDAHQRQWQVCPCVLTKGNSKYAHACMPKTAASMNMGAHQRQQQVWTWVLFKCSGKYAHVCTPKAVASIPVCACQKGSALIFIFIV